MNSEEQHILDWATTKEICEEKLLTEIDESVIGYLNCRIESCKNLLPKDK